jgi:hypothetical protein
MNELRTKLHGNRDGRIAVREDPAADPAAGLQHNDAASVFAQLTCRGEPCRAGTDDYRVNNVGLIHST